MPNITKQLSANEWLQIHQELQGGEDIGTLNEFIGQYENQVVKFHSYTTECPGYSGKVIILIGGNLDVYRFTVNFKTQKLTSYPSVQ